jgi:hypothetical protein
MREGAACAGLHNLLARLLVRQAGALVVALDVLQQAVVGARLVEVAEAAEDLRRVSNVVR